VLAELDLDLELFPDAPAGSAELAERQLFEVAKALVTNPKVLLLDEPTTALGPDEVEALHRSVDPAVRERGVGVVYVSHRLPRCWRSPTGSPCSATGATRGPSTPRPPPRPSWSS
jgi:ribose transport system ATP-binding protein